MGQGQTDGGNRKNLIERVVDSLIDAHRSAATKTLTDIGDTKQQNLYLRLTPGGVASWSVRYCPNGSAGKQRRVTIGRYPDMKTPAARALAARYDAAAKQGHDLRAIQQREKAEAERAERTVADALRAYVAEYCKKNQRRPKLVEQMFENHVYDSKFGKTPLAHVRRGDVVEFLQGLLHHKKLNAQVNRVHAQLRAALNWAVQRDWIDANPAAAVRRQFTNEKPRERILSDDELKAIWAVADALEDPSRALVKCWILTAQRRDEVRQMRWEELDLAARIWRLPGSRNKGKRDHLLPLPKAITDILEKLPRLGPYVFTCDVKGEKPYAGQARLKKIIDRETKDKKLLPWTFHDFRRTARTGMSLLGVREEVAERVLNHAQGRLVAVYNQHEYMDEKRHALERWSQHVLRIVGQGRGAANVVAFPKAAQ